MIVILVCLPISAPGKMIETTRNENWQDRISRQLVTMATRYYSRVYQDDVIKWKHFPRNWPFVRGIHRSRWIPTQRPVTRSFDVFFDLRLNKRLCKQPWGWWFETPSWSLWRQCNVRNSDWLVVSWIHSDCSNSTTLMSIKFYFKILL